MSTPCWCLQMEKDSRRAEQYLHQSLQYLRDPQECVQDWTIRFIGEPQPRVPLWAASVPPALAQCHIQESRCSLVAWERAGRQQGLTELCVQGPSRGISRTKARSCLLCFSVVSGE